MAQGGTVRRFREEKDCGFISPGDGGQDVFVHFCAIEGAGHGSLDEGLRATYEVVQGSREALQAENVSKVSKVSKAQEAVAMIWGALNVAMGSREGERIGEQIRTTLRDTNRQIRDLLASLPQRIRTVVMNGIEDGAMRLLQATREQLHGKPTREVEPCEVAEKAGFNPYSREYDITMHYLVDHGYLEPYPNLDLGSLGFYRVTNKGLEEILSNPQPPYEKLGRVINRRITTYRARTSLWGAPLRPFLLPYSPNRVVEAFSEA